MVLEEFLYLMQIMLMAEHHYRVACLDLRVTINKHTHVVTHQTAYSNTGWQFQVLDRFLGDR